MKLFSFESRTQYISDLQEEYFDLVIIGGGITGAGVARDASLRGMRVALVESNDFASGTSSRSSKLVHGGIRYLENREFKLVFEALSERQKLFQIAPHLVHPLRFMIPLYRGGRVGMALMGLGMWLYDALSLFQAPQLHERLDPGECMRRLPSLQGKDLLGGYVYSDAYMDDDRLVFETLRSAHAAGAKAVSYVLASGAKFDEKGQVSGVECTDKFTGKKFVVNGKHIVSTVGPWTDLVGELFQKDWSKILRPTKGVHLTFEKKRLPLSSAVVMGAEKRIVFGIPRHEMVIVGTTDTDFSGDPSAVAVTADDVHYLLGVIAEYFPGAQIKKEDIVAAYAGVRPLVQDHSESEGKTSREHTIFTSQQKVTYVAGGKYTTYRLMAEQIVAETLQYFSIEDKVRFNQGYSETPLNPLVTVEAIGQKANAIDCILALKDWTQAQAEVFFDRHGGEAMRIISRYSSHQELIELEALHAIDQTMCFHLVDFYTRRFPLFLAEPDHGASVLDLVINVFAERLDWDSVRRAEERLALEKYINKELLWRAAL